MLLHGSQQQVINKYIDNPAYDLQNSFVMETHTDVELAKNLVQKGFYQY
jgi:hypothetical protein